ncbi:VWA domain-containing protein [Bryobacter aggregatus]|uniref:VWA domain-containing protein n=1 Tax=Bryobacter aggregatus TaxID=360054 RepID=UPI0004E12E6B|nr:VWA domain-containing protein [Bryobacter aggregatus]
MLLQLLPLLLLSAPQEEQFKIRMGVDVVLLDTLVSRQNDIPVPELKASNFKVFVDAKEVALVHFSPQDSTVALAFLVDASGSMRPLRRITAIAAQSLFNLNKSGDEVSLIAFSDRPQVLLGPIPQEVKDATMLRDALLQRVAWEGRTSLYDAMMIGLNGLQSAHASRRALVVFSDGGDNQSVATKQQVQDAVRSQSVTVYAVALIDPESRDLDENFLRQISAESGGRYFRVTEPSTLESIQSVIAADIRGRYVLGIAGLPREPSHSARHRIRIECRDNQGNRLKTLARTTYYSREAIQ